MTDSNVVDINSPTANMFGVQPCPKCKSVFRYLPKVEGPQTIRCDDCGTDELIKQEDTE